MSTQKRELKLAGSGTARRGVVAALAIVALASVPGVHAADAGMTIVRDPATGQLRAPTAEEFKALEAQRSKAAPAQAAAAKTAPTEVRRADGSVMVVLDESHMSYSMVTRNADGTLTEQCVTGVDAANKVLSGKKASAAKGAQIAKENAHVHQ